MSSTRGSKGDQDSYYSRTRRRERSRSRSDDESYSQRRRRDSDRDRHYESRRDHHGSGDYKSRTRRSRSRSRDRYKRNEDSGSRGHDRHYDRSRDRKCRSSSERSRTPSPISHSPQPSDKVSSTNVPDSGISIKLGPAPLPFKPAASTLSTSTPGVGSRTGISAPIVRSKTVASIFNDDDDEEEEEMPPEAKMKMKNVGRNTPTSAGPNSFGKTKIGFCNALHIAGREMEEKQLNNK